MITVRIQNEQEVDGGSKSGAPVMTNCINLKDLRKKVS